MESGALLFNKERSIISKTEALAATKDFAKSLNCTDDKTWLKCARNVKASEVLDNYHVMLTNPVFGTEFLPELAHTAFSEGKFNKGMNYLSIEWFVLIDEYCLRFGSVGRSEPR